MFIRRKLSVSIFLALVLTMVSLIGPASAQIVSTTLDGSITFRDKNALSDSVKITLEQVPRPTAGKSLEGWLLGKDGSKISVGILTLTPTTATNQTYVDPNGANLLSKYWGFAVSEEPIPDPDPATPGPILYADSIPPGAFTHMGHLLVAWNPNPDAKGIVVGLREQAAVALRHAELARDSADLATKQLHSHHVINILQGSGGDNFDASFGNPGDGIGVAKYVTDTITHANLAKDAASDNKTVTDNADLVITAAGIVGTRSSQGINNALNLVAASVDDDSVRVYLENMIIALESAVTESKTAYTSSQDMGLFDLFRDPELGLPATGDQLVSTVALTALLAGFAFVAAGGGLIFVRRRAAVRVIA